MQLMWWWWPGSLVNGLRLRPLYFDARDVHNSVVPVGLHKSNADASMLRHYSCSKNNPIFIQSYRYFPKAHNMILIYILLLFIMLVVISWFMTPSDLFVETQKQFYLTFMTEESSDWAVYQTLTSIKCHISSWTMRPCITPLFEIALRDSLKLSTWTIEARIGQTLIVISRNSCLSQVLTCYLCKTSLGVHYAHHRVGWMYCTTSEGKCKAGLEY